MKRLFDIIGWTVIVVLVIMFHMTYAADRGAPTGDNRAVVAYPPELYVTLLDASPAAATGLSTAKDGGLTPKETKCVVYAGGTAPTSWTFAFYTGPDSTHMALAYPSGTTTTTVSSFPGLVSFTTGYGDRWWKINNVSTVGGDGTTTYTVKCTLLK